MARRTPRSRRTSRSKKEPGNQSEGISTDFDGLLEGEVSIGWEQSGIGLEVTISPSTVKLTLGIGIASVTLDLGELNNSSISYAFDIYEIKGYREGCNVRLDYYISGQLVKSENRTIPECEPEKKEPKKEGEEIDDENFPQIKDPPTPRNNYGNFVVAKVGSMSYKGILDKNGVMHSVNHSGHEVAINGSGNVTLEKIIHRNDKKPNLSSAVYVFNYHKKLSWTNFDNGHSNSSNGKGEFVLIRGSKDESLEEKLINLGHSNFFYTSSLQLDSFLPILKVDSPDFLTIHVKIATGTSQDALVRSISFSPWAQNYQFNGWSRSRVLTHPYLDATYSVSWTYKFLLEEYLDPPPSEPPMMVGKKRCCEEMKDCCKDIEKLEKKIAQIHKALAVKEVLDDGLEVPNRLVAPNGKGLKKLENYLEIATWQMRIQDHLGIHPFKASLTDANAAKAGNQKVEAQFVSGTAAMRKIVELQLENKGDAAARLNLQVRSAIALAQILQVVTIISKSVDNLISFVGMPFQEKISTIRMPFDISLGQRKADKGFDPKAAKDNASKEIQINEEDATEEILPKFLNSSDHPYVHPKFDGKFLSLIELIKGVTRNG